MADVTLTRTSLAEAGTDLTSGLQAMAAADDYFFDNQDGVPLIYLVATAAVAVTIETPFVAAGESLPDKVINMANGDALLLKPRTKKYYNQPDGTVKISVDAAGASVGVYVP